MGVGGQNLCRRKIGYLPEDPPLKQQSLHLKTKILHRWHRFFLNIGTYDSEIDSGIWELFYSSAYSVVNCFTWQLVQSKWFLAVFDDNYSNYFKIISYKTLRVRILTNNTYLKIIFIMKNLYQQVTSPNLHSWVWKAWN